MQLTPAFAHRHVLTVHRDPDTMLSTLDRSQQSSEMGCVITLLLLVKRCGQWRYWVTGPRSLRGPVVKFKVHFGHSVSRECIKTTALGAAI